MNLSDTPRSLDLLETGTDSGGCGCGGCGCGSTDASQPETDTQANQVGDTTTQRFAVAGMTCGHCASAVTRELGALDGVTDVTVDLVAGGTSAVTVRCKTPLEESQVVAALDEAGGYRLA